MVRIGNTLNNNKIGGGQGPLQIQSDAIDWLRFVLAIMVVLIHTVFSVEYELTAGQIDWAGMVHFLFCNVICCAAVPTFFMISGYLFFKNLETWNTPIYLEKIKKRVKTLFIPFLIAATTMLILAYCMSVYRSMNSGQGVPSFLDFWQHHGFIRYLWDNRRLGETLQPNVLGYIVHGCNPILSPLWFIRDLMVACLFSPLFYFLAKKTGKIGLAIVGLLMCTNIWIPIEGLSSNAFFFFFLGSYIRLSGNSLYSMLRPFRWWAYAGSIVFIILSLYFKYVDYSYNIVYVCPRAFIIFGTISFINIAFSLMENNICKVHRTLSNSSMFIYLTHCIYITAISSAVIHHIIPSITQTGAVISYFVTCALTVTICVSLYAMLNKICPSLLKIYTGGR